MGLETEEIGLLPERGSLGSDCTPCSPICSTPAGRGEPWAQPGMSLTKPGVTRLLGSGLNT